MNHLTPELIAKAKAAKSAEELLELAKENDIELTEDEAKICFEQLHANAEISDDELEAVSGGGICQDIIDFFRGRNGRNDSTCPYCDDTLKPSNITDKPTADSGITTLPYKPTLDGGITTLPYNPLPDDSNDKNKIVFL